MTETDLTDEDYRTIEAFRMALRRFLRFSEDAARQAGLSPQQHQLALAIRGFAGEGLPTVGEIADALQIRHHSCVGLVDRLEAQGLVVREHDTIDARKVHLRLTELGDEKLSRLTNAHRLEHRQLGSVLDALLKLRATGSVVDHGGAGEWTRP